MWFLKPLSIIQPFEDSLVVTHDVVKSRSSSVDPLLIYPHLIYSPQSEHLLENLEIPLFFISRFV